MAPTLRFMVPRTQPIVRSTFKLIPTVHVTPIVQLLRPFNFHLGLYNQQLLARNFSVVSRKKAEKKLAKRRVKKYKLKTKKAFQKRVRVVGKFSEKAFKYYPVGHRHLNRNKSKRALKHDRTHRHLLTTPGDIRRAKRLMPYFKRRKFLKC